MKVKEKFKIEEQEILLASLDHYSDAIKRIRILISGNEKTKFDPELRDISDVRTKLILQMHPIEIHNEDLANIYLAEDWFGYCFLCGESSSISFPKSPHIKGHCVCPHCFEKYSPRVYKKTFDSNKKFHDKENKFWEKQLAKEESESKELGGSNLLEEDLPF